MKNYVFKLLEKYDYDWNQIYVAMKKKEFVSDGEVEKYDHYKNFLTIVDDKYPPQLKYTSTPPFALFFKGNSKILNDLNFSTLIQGGETLTKYGKELCLNIVKKCKEMNNTLILCNWTYVAKYCIDIANKINVKVLSIISNGRNYIKENQLSKNILYVSLFLDDVSSNNKRKKASMWLAAAFCYRCIIPEIELNKAKMFIIDECLAMGKKVYAYPTNITNFNQGTNYLIKQGASILIN